MYWRTLEGRWYRRRKERALDAWRGSLSCCFERNFGGDKSPGFWSDLCLGGCRGGSCRRGSRGGSHRGDSHHDSLCGSHHDSRSDSHHDNLCGSHRDNLCDNHHRDNLCDNHHRDSLFDIDYRSNCYCHDCRYDIGPHSCIGPDRSDCPFSHYCCTGSNCHNC